MGDVAGTSGLMPTLEDYRTTWRGPGGGAMQRLNIARSTAT
jgi:hypothetical protein